MLVLGLVLRCLNPVLTIVASLSSKPLFVSPLEKREAAARYDFWIVSWVDLTSSQSEASF